MKKSSLLAKALLFGACVAFVGVATTNAASDRHVYTKPERAVTASRPRPVERVVLVTVTGSWIPQRVVIAGNNVNSASPLYVMQSHDLLRSGASTVSGMLANDPSVFFRRR